MGSVAIAWFCVFCRLCYRDESLPPRIPVLSPCLEVGMIIWSSVESLPPRIPVLSPCLEVVVITHERQRHHEMDDYFARKFAPLHIMFVIGRSYKSDAECEPRVAFIRCLEGPCYLDTFHSHIIIIGLRGLFREGARFVCSCSLIVNGIPTPNPQRQHRSDREWKMRQKLRTFVHDMSEAAPPIALFHFLQSQFHHHTFQLTA